jgi:hypothetical protein
MHRPRSAWLTASAFASLSLLAAPACYAQKRATAQDTWVRSYAIPAGARFELVNVNGAIRAESSDAEGLELIGKRSVRAATESKAQASLAQLEMREDVGEHGARVEVIPPESFGGADVEVRWTVRVPKGVAVDLRTENGPIALAGLTGEVRAATVNGAIRGEALGASAISAETVNGEVELELTTPLPGDGRIALESVNGGVALALPAESRASVSAEVVNGGIDTNGLELAAKGERSRTELEGTLNGGGAEVTLETVNGGVRLSRSRAAEGPPAPTRDDASAG